MTNDFNEKSAYQVYKNKSGNCTLPTKKKSPKKLKILLKPSKKNKVKTNSMKKKEKNVLIKEEMKNMLGDGSKVLKIKKVKNPKKNITEFPVKKDNKKKTMSGNSKLKGKNKELKPSKQKKAVSGLNHTDKILNENEISLKKKSKVKKLKIVAERLETQNINFNQNVTMKVNTKKLKRSEKNSNNISIKNKDLQTPMKVKKNNSVVKFVAKVSDKNDKISYDNDKTITEDNCIKMDSSNTSDSALKGQELFSWILGPVNVETFFRESWESRPLHVSRNCTEYFKSFLTVDRIDQMLRNHELFYGRNIDITSYSNGVRETHNLVGRAHPAVVWDYYLNGCSVRLLNPQSYVRKLHSFNAFLQEFFGCFVGANAYLTPPNSQGFAPHYDDIEAFVLQIEGEKLWKLYSPRYPSEVFPRFSSGNFKEEDLSDCIMEVKLQPGDVLYFPRGIIHQGHTLPDKHSLHITLSVYQKNSWADLLEKLLPVALKTAVEENSEFREGLPMNYFSCMGVVHSDSNRPERIQFLEKLQKLLTNIFQYAPVDAVVDQLCKQFQHDALPPVLFPEEKVCSVFAGGLKMLENGKVVNHVELELDTKIRLLRRNILRLVLEEDVVRIYHSVNNSKVYHEIEQQFLEIDEKMAPAVEMLIHSYPMFISIDNLPLKNLEMKMQLATDLWESGLIITENPLSDNE